MGRNISYVAAMYEGVVGAALLAAVFTLLPPTTGGMLVLALPSGGVIILLGGMAIVGELAVAGAGGMAALHAGLMFKQIKNNPASGMRPKSASKVLQTGGNTLTTETLNALGLTKEEGKLAIERLKSDIGRRNDFHGKILSDGNVIDSSTGQRLGNLFDYLP